MIQLYLPRATEAGSSSGYVESTSLVCVRFYLLSLTGRCLSPMKRSVRVDWEIIPVCLRNPRRARPNWIRSSKFETVRIHFLSDIFGLLSPRNFATMATWHNDFSTLLDFQLVLCVLNKRQNDQYIWCISLSTPTGTWFMTCPGPKGSNPDKDEKPKKSADNIYCWFLINLVAIAFVITLCFVHLMVRCATQNINSNNGLKCKTKSQNSSCV